jgi:hypothetical protein
VAAVFWLPAASVALFAATSTVIVPSADGVIVAVYVVPLPDSEAEPPPTVMSLATKLLVDSEKVIVTSKVEEVTGLDAELVIATVGTVKSTLTEPESAEVSALPVLPATSAYPAVTEKVAVPSASLPLSSSAHVYEVPEPEAVPASLSIVQAGADCRFSEEVMDRVIVSPLLA